MKAPSPLVLQALRRLAFMPASSTQCPTITCRAYASAPQTQTKPSQTSSIPSPSSTKRPSKPPTPASPPSQPPLIDTKRNEDNVFIPKPLWRPIGMATPAQPGENSGIDSRTAAQKRADFTNYEKHLQRRAALTKQVARPYFRDWSNMKFQEGKVFVANERLFRAEHALFFPNFFGETLEKDAVRQNPKDGYGGLGRDTCIPMQGKVSVVSFVNTAWADQQAQSFVGRKENPALAELLDANTDVAQKVELNYEDNTLRYWVLKLFGIGPLRKQRSVEEQKRYFIIRRGVTDIVKEAIGLLNIKVGFVYLVDAEGRIRWAGSAVAEEHEKQSLNKGVRNLILEARGERKMPAKIVDEEVSGEVAP